MHSIEGFKSTHNSKTDEKITFWHKIMSKKTLRVGRDKSQVRHQNNGSYWASALKKYDGVDEKPFEHDVHHVQSMTCERIR